MARSVVDLLQKEPNLRGPWREEKISKEEFKVNLDGFSQNPSLNFIGEFLAAVEWPVYEIMDGGCSPLL